MHLTMSKSANAVSYYVSETVTKDGKKSTAIVEKLGTDKQIKRKYKVDDAESWAERGEKVVLVRLETLQKISQV